VDFLGRYSKNPQIENFMKIRPVGAELFHEDRQTDMTKMETTKSPETLGRIVQNFWPLGGGPDSRHD
jgi:hypothetical protein